MKILWQNELNGRSGLVAEPDGYDGTPWLRELWMDRAPVSLHADRVAVAAALIFGSAIAGDLEFERPVSIGVSEAIKQFCTNMSLNVWPVDYVQRPHAIGSGTLKVHSGGLAPSERPHVLGNRSMDIGVLRSDLYAGSLLSSNGLFVSSNAYLHDAAAERLQRPGYGSLAVAVLFAEDLGMDTCVSEHLDLPFETCELLVAAGLRTA